MGVASRPKGFNFCTGIIGPAMPCEGSLGHCRVPQQLARPERIGIWIELASAACFCRSPDGCAQENEILDEELARIPQQGESV
jgi:hypothetical protein